MNGQTSTLPQTVFVVKVDEEDDESFYAAFDNIADIGHARIVGVYRLDDMRVKRVAHSLISEDE